MSTAKAPGVESEGETDRWFLLWLVAGRFLHLSAIEVISGVNFSSIVFLLFLLFSALVRTHVHVGSDTCEERDGGREEGGY